MCLFSVLRITSHSMCHSAIWQLFENCCFEIRKQSFNCKLTMWIQIQTQELISCKTYCMMMGNVFFMQHLKKYTCDLISRETLISLILYQFVIFAASQVKHWWISKRVSFVPLKIISKGILRRFDMNLLFNNIFNYFLSFPEFENSALKFNFRKSDQNNKKHHLNFL